MSNIGSLVVSLEANIAKYTSDMGKAAAIAEQRMQQIQQSIDMAKNAIFGLTGALAGIGSFNAFTGMIDKVIQTKVELSRLSTQTGASVESLSAISAVSKMTGTDIGSVGSAMNKLQKNLASSTDESKGAAQAIAALGLNFKDFVRQSPDNQMLNVAKAMDQFSDGGGKSAAAMLLFGKSGAELLPMLEQLAQKNELVGKQTTQSAKQAEEYEKSIVQLSAASEAWKRQMVEGMLPTLNAVADAMVRARKEGGLLASVMAGVQTLLTGDDKYKNDKALVEDTEKLLSLEKSISQFKQQGYGDDSKVIQNAKAQLADVQANINTTMAYRKELEKVEDAKTKIEEARKNRPALDASLGVKPVSAGQSDYDKINKQTMEAINLANAQLGIEKNLTESEKFRIKMLTEIDLSKLTAPEKAMFKVRVNGIAAMQDEIKTREWLSKAQQINLEEQKKAWEAAEAYSTQLDRTLGDLAFETSLLGLNADEQKRMTALRKADEEAQKSIDATKADPAAQANAIKQAADARILLLKGMDAQIAKQDELNTSWQYGAKTALEAYLKDVSNVADQTRNAVTEAFKGMEDVLVNFFKTGTLDAKAMFDSIITNMIRMQIQASIEKPLLAGYQSGGFSGMLSAGATILGFAGGGDPPLNVPSIVGEHGPELFIPKAAGTIIPNGGNSGNQSGQAQPLTVVQNFTVGDVASISQLRKAVAGSEMRISAAFARSRGYGGVVA